MIRAIAAAVVTMVAAALSGSPSAALRNPVEGQPDEPALAHEYAGINGVRLHYYRASGIGPPPTAPSESGRPARP